MECSSQRELLPAFFAFAHRALAASEIRLRAAAESLRLDLRAERLRPVAEVRPSKAAIAASIRSRSCFSALRILAVSIDADYSRGLYDSLLNPSSGGLRTNVNGEKIVESIFLWASCIPKIFAVASSLFTEYNRSRKLAARPEINEAV